MSDSYQIFNPYDAFYPQPKLPDDVCIDALETAKTFLLNYFKALNEEDLLALETLSETDNNFLDSEYSTLERSLNTKANGGYYTVYTRTITDLQGDMELELSHSDSYDLYYRTELFCSYDRSSDEYYSYGEDPVPEGAEPYHEQNETSNTASFIFYLGRGADGTWVIDRVEYSSWGSLYDLDLPVPLSF